MRITDARVIVCSPGRNFVTLKIETEDGIHGLGDATLNGRELAVASYLRDHVATAAHRARRPAHRGHLAVPLQGRVLAARAGHDDRDRGRRYGALGHPGQGAANARVSTARRSVARSGADLRPRERRDHRRDGGGGRRIRRAGYGRCGRSAACPACPTRTASAGATLYYEPAEKRGRSKPPGAPRSTSTSCRSCSRGCATSSVPTSTCSTTPTIG